MYFKNICCKTILLTVLLIFAINFKFVNAQVLIQPAIGSITNINSGTDRIIEMIEDDQNKSKDLNDENSKDDEMLNTSNGIETFYPPAEMKNRNNERYTEENSDIETFKKTVPLKDDNDYKNSNHSSKNDRSHTKIITAVSGGKLKVDTGNGGEIENKIVGADIAVVRELKTSSGKFSIGGVVDYNHNSYDNNFKGIDGSGDSDAITVGIIAKQSRDDGVYYEGSVRFGRAKTDFATDNFSDIRYEESAPVYAGHAKVGKIVNFDEKNSADIYGTYTFAHQDKININLSNDEKYRMGSIDSNRIKVGCLMSTKIDDNGRIYYGLAYQYEGSEKVKLHNEFETDLNASGKGSSGVLELGYKISADKDLNLDLRASGFTGRQKGVILQAQLVKLF